MKKIIPALILGLILGALAAWLYTRTTTPTSDASAPATAAAPAAPEKPNPLRLDAAARAKAGITLIKPVTATLTPEVEGFARVLDTAPLVAMAADLKTARVALDASQQDLDRTQKLYDAGGNASAQALQTAQAAVARDTAALSAARAKLTVTWGGDFAQNTNGITDAVMQGSPLVRIDLLSGDTPPALMPKTAHLLPFAAPPSVDALEVEIIRSPAPTADPQLQGDSFLAIIPPKTISTFSYSIGTLLRATLTAEGKPTTTLTIPRSAIVYHQGSAWLYILGEEDTFERKHVTLGRSLPDDRIAITTGLDDPDDQVVTTGAQQLLSAELQSGDTGDED